MACCAAYLQALFPPWFDVCLSSATPADVDGDVVGDAAMRRCCASCGTIGTFSRSEDVTRIARTSKTVLQSVCHSVFEPVCLLARHSFIHSFIHSGSRRQRRKLSSYIEIYIHIYLDLSLPSLAVVLVAVVSLR